MRDYWSEGNQFYFLDDNAWSVSPNGGQVSFDAEQVEKALAERVLTGYNVLDNLITIDRIEKNRSDAIARTPARRTRINEKGLNGRK